MNIAIIKGFVGKNPDSKTTATGISMASFSVATKQYKKGKIVPPIWHNCRAYGGTAEVVSAHVKKGMEVVVVGKINNYFYEADDGSNKRMSEIVVQTIEFCGKRLSAEPLTEPQTTQPPVENDLLF